MKRIFLLTGSIRWGVSIAGVFLPWNMMDIILQNMGCGIAITDPQIPYRFRMATTAWSIIGFFYLAILLFPQKIQQFDSAACRRFDF